MKTFLKLVLLFQYYYQYYTWCKLFQLTYQKHSLLSLIQWLIPPNLDRYNNLYMLNVWPFEL